MNNLCLFKAKTNTWILFFTITILFSFIGCENEDSENKITKIWMKKSSMPTGRGWLTSDVVNNKIYVIGGWNGINNLNNVEEYDTEKDTWTCKKAMPTARGSASCAVVKSKIYVIGGASPTKVEEYNTETDNWSIKASMPTPRYGLTCCMFDNKIYAIGGWNNSISLKTVEEYNPETNNWTTKASLPTARGAATSVLLNNKIYVIGGGNEFNDYLKVVEAYDPVIDSWTTETSLPVARGAACGCAFNNRIYLFGGAIDDKATSMGLNTVYEYDPFTNKWITKTSMPTARNFISCNIVNNKIYVIGGKGDVEDMLDIVEEYNIELDTE